MSSSISSLPHSSWPHLPIELLSLVVSYTSIRAVLHLALVNRRLHQLLLKPSESEASRSSVWSKYPPVTLSVEEHARQLVVAERVVRVAGDRFDFKCRDNQCRDNQCVSLLLCALRRITALHLVIARPEMTLYTAVCEVPLSLCPPLHNLTQLRSLEIHGIRYMTATSLTAALDTLPSLIELKLITYDVTESDQLTSTLHRLCRTQLLHLTCSRRQLHFLVQHHRRATMPHLRSLDVTPSPRLDDSAGRPLDAVGSSWPALFPSLLHLAVGDCSVLEELTDAQLPQLSSLAAHVHVSAADFTLVNTRAFCVYCCEDDDSEQSPRERMLQQLTRAPHMQQLTLSDNTSPRNASDRVSQALLPAAAASCSDSLLSSLVYLEFVNGVTLADCTYLLTYTAPPVFAAQLTHLALRMQLDDRAVAAALLPTLPSMYPSLTHVHVGLQCEPKDEQPAECVAWDAAVKSLKAALGSAWCASEADVVACREDVAWRRSVGLAQQTLVSQKT